MGVAQFKSSWERDTPIQPKTGSCMKARPKGHICIFRAKLKNHGGKHRDFARDN